MPQPRKPITRRQPTPAAFLKQLGIRKIPIEKVSDRAIVEMARKAGADPSMLYVYGTFSPQAGDVFFVTEQIAKRYHSEEYDELIAALDYVGRLARALPKLSRIADIGGGTGIVSLYLAACYPGCKVMVFDHSPRQLELGRKWATEHDIRNIKFAKASYRQLAVEPQKATNDIVLFLRAIDLRLRAPESGDTSLSIETCPRERPKPAASIQAPFTAIAKLIKPRGIGVIGCRWSGWGLINKFEACRRAHLGVDWQLTECRFEVWDGRQGVVDRVYVRKGMPHLGRDSYEDAQGYLSALMPRANTKWLSRKEIAKHAKEFDKSPVLLNAEGTNTSGKDERLRVAQKEGVLLMVLSSAGKDCGGMIRSLTGLADILDMVRSYCDNWKSLKALDIAPPLDAYVEFPD